MRLELIKAPSRISRITVAYLTSIIPQMEQTQLTQLYKFDPYFHHTAKRVTEKKTSLKFQVHSDLKGTIP